MIAVTFTGPNSIAGSDDELTNFGSNSSTCMLDPEGMQNNGKLCRWASSKSGMLFTSNIKAHASSDGELSCQSCMYGSFANTTKLMMLCYESHSEAAVQPLAHIAKTQWGAGDVIMGM
jgi:hypothetical protein